MDCSINEECLSYLPACYGRRRKEEESNEEQVILLF